MKISNMLLNLLRLKKFDTLLQVTSKDFLMIERVYISHWPMFLWITISLKKTKTKTKTKTFPCCSKQPFANSTIFYMSYFNIILPSFLFCFVFSLSNQYTLSGFHATVSSTNAKQLFLLKTPEQTISNKTMGKETNNPAVSTLTRIKVIFTLYVDSLWFLLYTRPSTLSCSWLIIVI